MVLGKKMPGCFGRKNSSILYSLWGIEEVNVKVSVGVCTEVPTCMYRCVSMHIQKPTSGIFLHPFNLIFFKIDL